MTCVECGSKIPWYRRMYSCDDCKAGPLCSQCSNHAAIDGSFASGTAVVLSTCITCAVNHTSIDFNRTVDTFGPNNGAAPCIVMVHAAGSSRRMWIQLSRVLVKSGFRCVLPDLPGHASRLDEPLSLDACIDTLKSVVDEHCAPYNGLKPIYLGGSLGGYIGMELMGRFPSMFSAAVLVVCNQKVGEGASAASRFGAWAMASASRMLRTSTLVKGIVATIQKDRLSINLEDLDESGVRGGWWLEQFGRQMEILRECNSQKAINSFTGPVLYIAGEMDHRDMEAELVGISKRNEEAALELLGSPNPVRSRSFVYLNVNHFLMVDWRSQRLFNEDVLTFCRTVVADHENLHAKEKCDHRVHERTE